MVIHFDTEWGAKVRELAVEALIPDGVEVAMDDTAAMELNMADLELDIGITTAWRQGGGGGGGGGGMHTAADTGSTDSGYQTTASPVRSRMASPCPECSVMETV